MSLELIGHGIRVNAVAPGLTDTAQPRYGNTDAELMEMGRALPIGRMGRPAEIAEVAVFLASDRSSFMVGQTVHANGGRTCRHRLRFSPRVVMRYREREA